MHVFRPIKRSGEAGSRSRAESFGWVCSCKKGPPRHVRGALLCLFLFAYTAVCSDKKICYGAFVALFCSREVEFGFFCLEGCEMGKWIGVDLDGVLAEYTGAMGNLIGRPIVPMMVRVKDWVACGVEVRIFTARACDPAQIPNIKNWLVNAGLPELVVTNIKDFDMTELYDDKAIRVKRNVGYICGGCYRMKRGS